MNNIWLTVRRSAFKWSGAFLRARHYRISRFQEPQIKPFKFAARSRSRLDLQS